MRRRARPASISKVVRPGQQHREAGPERRRHRAAIHRMGRTTVECSTARLARKRSVDVPSGQGHGRLERVRRPDGAARDAALLGAGGAGMEGRGRASEGHRGLRHRAARHQVLSPTICSSGREGTAGRCEEDPWRRFLQGAAGRDRDASSHQLQQGDGPLLRAGRQTESCSTVQSRAELRQRWTWVAA